MSGVEAKICGLTRPADAAHAVAAGASYLGVVFASGPRVVTAAQAREVVEAAGGVPVFGVFGRESVDAILHLRDVAGLSGAQLHGDYDARAARLLRQAGMRVWRVARLADRAAIASLDSLAADADAVLVEPRVPGAEGGTGVALGLEVAAAARETLREVPMVLAGGLTAATVAAAIAAVAPDVVDVSSGVEEVPGIKSAQQVTHFLEAVAWALR